VQKVEGSIEDRLANGVVKHLAPRQDYPTGLSPRCSRLRIAVTKIEPGHLIRKVVDDPFVILTTLSDNPFQFLSVIGAKTILIAVRAAPMTEVSKHKVYRFHVISRTTG